MRTITILTILLTILFTHAVVLAGPAGLSCQAAITRLSQAQQRMQAQQTKVEKAKREKQVLDANIGLCQPGGIVTGSSVRRCIQLRQDLPKAIRTLADAEGNFQQEAGDFRSRIDTVIRECE